MFTVLAVLNVLNVLNVLVVLNGDARGPLALFSYEIAKKLACRIYHHITGCESHSNPSQNK